MTRQDVSDGAALLQRRIERIDRSAWNPESANNAFLLQDTHSSIDCPHSRHFAPDRLFWFGYDHPAKKRSPQRDRISFPSGGMNGEKSAMSDDCPEMKMKTSAMKGTTCPLRGLAPRIASISLQRGFLAGMIPPSALVSSAATSRTSLPRTGKRSLGTREALPETEIAARGSLRSS